MATRKAIDELMAFCVGEGYTRIRVVADGNTWGALGKLAAQSLRGSGIAVVETIFENGVQADEAALGLLLAGESGEPSPLLAVGSGTITDLVRFYASRMRLPFLSLPTAASVDAYASSVAAMSLGGEKRTVSASPPQAIFVDLETLCGAPPLMTAAGFADTICKFTALADWRLGSLVWDEPWDASIAARARGAADSCVAVASRVGRLERDGIETLMKALLESGRAMGLAGHSRSASGAEHHLSHYWEMALAREKRRPLLHGLKVGVATVMMAGLWERIARIEKREAAERLGDSRAFIDLGGMKGRGEAIPAPGVTRARGGGVDEAGIMAEFGAAGRSIIATQRRFLALDEEGMSALKEKLLGNWDSIRGLATAVPGRGETIAMLQKAGCPTIPSELGLERRLVEAAWRFGHCLRDRFTVRRLGALLGIDELPG